MKKKFVKRWKKSKIKTAKKTQKKNLPQTSLKQESEKKNSFLFFWVAKETCFFIGKVKFLLKHNKIKGTWKTYTCESFKIYTNFSSSVTRKNSTCLSDSLNSKR